MKLILFVAMTLNFAFSQTPTPAPVKMTPRKGHIKCGNLHCVEIILKNKALRIYLSEPSGVLVPYQDKKITLQVQTSPTEKYKAVPLIDSYEFLLGNSPVDDATLSKSRIMVTVIESGKTDIFDFVIDEMRSPFKK